MKTRLFTLFALWACTLVQAQAQQSFPYPAIPDTLRSVEQRAGYLSEHYWDNYNFADTLLLKSKEVTEQGFVNFIDILNRFNLDNASKGVAHKDIAQKGITRKDITQKDIAQKDIARKDITQQGIACFTRKAFSNAAAKERFENLIEHYFEDQLSPIRNDRVYLIFLEEMKNSPCFDETEKERIAFKIRTTNKNLPGDIAINFKFKDENGKEHQLSDYKDQKVILYFYDPDCENCHEVSAWLKQQTIPADIKVLKMIADNHISYIYSLKNMPTIFLLDKENKVILKDCTAQELIENISTKYISQPR
mgnify:CR=1 FL=1